VPYEQNVSHLVRKRSNCGGHRRSHLLTIPAAEFVQLRDENHQISRTLCSVISKRQTKDRRPTLIVAIYQDHGGEFEVVGSDMMCCVCRCNISASFCKLCSPGSRKEDVIQDPIILSCVAEIFYSLRRQVFLKTVNEISSIAFVAT
jgi:hypothetical protein